jgi:hypothetical protein
MGVQAQEIAATLLPAQTLREWIGELACFLDTVGHGPYSVELGWGATLPTEQLWHQVEVAPKDIPALIRESEAKGVIRLGTSDLIIRSKERAINFTICHDSDIHFVSSDEDLLRTVTALWRAKGWEVYQSAYAVGGRREWTKVLD